MILSNQERDSLLTAAFPKLKGAGEKRYWDVRYEDGRICVLKGGKVLTVALNLHPKGENTLISDAIDETLLLSLIPLVRKNGSSNLKIDKIINKFIG